MNKDRAGLQNRACTLATTSCPNHKNITPTTLNSSTEWEAVCWGIRRSATGETRESLRGPDCTHTQPLWSAALLVSSTSRSQSKSLGSRDRGETAFIPGPCSGKSVKGGLRPWGTSLSSPICNAQLVFSRMYSEWSAPKVVISQRKCTSYSYRADAIPGDGTPPTPSDHTRQEAEPWSQTLLAFLVLTAKY